MSKQAQKQWKVAENTGFDGLKLDEKAPIPEIGDKEVLVKCKACPYPAQNAADDFNLPQSTAPP